MILTFLFFFSCGKPLGQEKDTFNYEVKGKVMHLSTFHYEAKESNGEIVRGEPIRNGETDFTISFNKHGYITLAYFYGKNDSLDVKLIRNLDKHNNCLGEVRYNYRDVKLYESLWSYDQDRNNTERATVLIDGSVFTYANLYYNDKGQLIARKDLKQNKSNMFDSLAWEYDKKGRQVVEEKYNNYGHLSTNKFEYLGNSKKANKILFNNQVNKLKGYIDITYNANDLLSKAIQFSADSTVLAQIEINYEYDEKNNWIKKIEYFNGVPNIYQERKIIYF
jgi:hypothetical protein